MQNYSEINDSGDIFRDQNLNSETFFIFVGILITIVIIFFIKKVIDIKNKTLQHKIISEIEKQSLNETISTFIHTLRNLQQESLLNYSFYKQLLYLKTKVYHSTNLTSIYSIHKKTPSDIKQFQKTFEEGLIKIIRNQIKVKTNSLISQTQKVFDKFQRSQQRFYLDQDINHKKMKKISNQIVYKVADLFKYNIKIRRQMQKLKQNVNNLKQIYKQAQKSEQDKSYINIIEYEINLISELINFIYFVQSNINQYLKTKTNSQFQKSIPLNQKIYKIHSNIIRSFDLLNKSKQKNQNQLSQRNKTQNKQFNRFIKCIESFIENKKSTLYLENLSHSLNKDTSNFYHKQINQLQMLQQNLMNQKQRIKKQLQKGSSQNYENKSIKVYDGANLSELENKTQEKQIGQQNQIKIQNHKDKQNFARLGQDLIFSKQNKLSFMKQLDRLMIRNRIKRQMQEMDKKMKQQQDQQRFSQQQSNQNQSNSIVLLQKI